MLKALQTARTSLDFTIEEHDFGGIAIDNHGDPLPDSTLEACKSASAVLLGAVGGPKWGPGSKVRPEQGILRLRKALNLYANIRPALFPSESLVQKSPLKEELAKGPSSLLAAYSHRLMSLSRHRNHCRARIDRGHLLW